MQLDNLGKLFYTFCLYLHDVWNIDVKYNFISANQGMVKECLANGKI